MIKSQRNKSQLSNNVSNKSMPLAIKDNIESRAKVVMDNQQRHICEDMVCISSRCFCCMSMAFYSDMETFILFGTLTAFGAYYSGIMGHIYKQWYTSYQAPIVQFRNISSMEQC